MFKSIIQSFLPWILFFILAGNAQHVAFAISVAAISSIIFELKGLQKGFILSWGTLLFFTFLFFLVVFLKNHWVLSHIWILSNAMLAGIAWVSLLLGCPFTLQYAKEQVSADKWKHPLFIRINILLTGMWGTVFLLGVVLKLIRLYHPQLNGIIYELASYIPSIFGIWFTTWFPDWYRRKAIISKSFL